MSTSTTSRFISVNVLLLSICTVTASPIHSDSLHHFGDFSSFELSTSFHCGNQSQCEPGKQSQHNQCQYIKSCCSDTLGDDGLVNYLDLQYCTFNTLQPLGIVVFALLVFYSFLILGDVADDYFAPTMAELAEFLKVPHELAGVTFVAVNVPLSVSVVFLISYLSPICNSDSFLIIVSFVDQFGNGAPDISSSVAAITQGGDTTKLGLGALLGAAIFDSIAVSGAIAVLVDNPSVARRPFLRDCFFLFVAAGCVLFITSDGNVHIAEALGMVIIYVFYVGSVLLGEIYKSYQRKKRRESRRRRQSSQKSSVPPEERRDTITDKIMPALGVFSNESMRDLFKTAPGHTGNASVQSLGTVDEIHIAQQNGLDPIDSVNPITDPMNPQNSIPPSGSMPQLQRGVGAASMTPDVPYIHDLYHQLNEEDKTKHHHGLHNHHRNEADFEDSILSSSSSDDGILSESSDSDVNRAWWKSAILYLVRGPTLLVALCCKLTIPLTDKNWNDWVAIISCTTAPVFIQFAFASNTMWTKIGDVFPVVFVVLICGMILSLITYLRVQKKYLIGREDSLVWNDPIHKSPADNTSVVSSVAGAHNREMTGDSGTDVSSPGSMNTVKLGSSTTSSPNPRYQRLNGVDPKEQNHKKQRTKHKADPDADLRKEPVMKLFFLMLGFVSAVGWIELVANELVNLLTTLGVISTVDLAILGLTVLAWGNSIGDLIADVSVSRKGYAKMGISAAIGGPTLNVLIGVGMGTTINTLRAKGGVLKFPDTSNIFVCCVAVMVGIAIYAVWTALNKWTLRRSFGYFCFVYYFGFLAVNVLVYERVIKLPFGK